jgi:hypothetical protein
MGETIYETEDFKFVDEGKGKGLTLSITTPNGRLNQSYASSIKLNQVEIALNRATRMQVDIKKIQEEDEYCEKIKNVLREKNPQLIRKGEKYGKSQSSKK